MASEVPFEWAILTTLVSEPFLLNFVDSFMGRSLNPIHSHAPVLSMCDGLCSSLAHLCLSFSMATLHQSVETQFPS